MKLTIKAWFVVGLMALTFLIAFKWVAAKLKISGLETAVSAA